VHNQVHTFFNLTENYLHLSFGIRVRSEIVKDLLGDPVGKKILDVGCGNGAISSQFISENHITFLDLSENMIGLVRQSIDPRFSSNADFMVGSFTEIPVRDSFDYVFAIGLLAHVPSVIECLKKINSLLASDGYAIVQFSDYDNWLTRVNIRKATSYGYPINRLSFGSMQHAVSASGFRIVKEIRFSFLLPGMGRLPEDFLYRYTRFSWKNKTMARLGTDVIWLLQRQHVA